MFIESTLSFALFASHPVCVCVCVCVCMCVCTRTVLYICAHARTNAHTHTHTHIHTHTHTHIHTHTHTHAPTHTHTHSHTPTPTHPQQLTSMVKYQNKSQLKVIQGVFPRITLPFMVTNIHRSRFVCMDAVCLFSE